MADKSACIACAGDLRGTRYVTRRPDAMLY
jgi:hypothetical protein